ncbi:N-6 DNA methylase [Betaproteobacteria bacterium SCN2]|jgi:predicted type IV restriction endonuclease|nr:N-6 DNA methylase [Betaproteobacteria bacterium SCN2]
MPAPTELHDLVARFREQHEDYRRGAYNETQLRRDFLDPLFALLGWDVDNRAGYAESFREVVHEDAVKVGGMTKAPDYSFRIGGRRLFFLEAKKPAIHIKEEIPPAYQLRRYAWSAGLQLSILSDFEEFAVYDGSIKPNPKDKPAKARVFYCTYEEYADRWDEIAALFSKEAVLKGGIDRFVKKLPGRRGTATVDAEFLAQIEHWRDLLARNIALRNDLDVHALNHAVQATIDRIVFLRICEDRGIENEGRLLALTNGSGIYARLTQLFRDADDRYNSGLFHFRNEKNRAGEPDAYTLELAIDDKPLKDIIRGLYYPESPYEFAVLPADILGQVYERFLGKVIRLTGGGQAKVEEKPEVKKAGGVYYTPTYIVDYIVRQTVGRLLEGKNPKQAERLRICDPACGSGSFLIGAYQHLLDWHLKWYAENDPQKHASGKSPKLRQSHDGWRLTVAERKRILIHNIYGVDIDAQAVEVTKLSLLLKVLEGETGETLGLAQMKLFHERALPNLDANILCGNSLIGTDFYDGRLDLDEEERRRINAFDWEAGFPEVFKAGGFDAVIGNPPYIRIQTLKEWAPLEVEHYKTAYRAASKGNYDIYAVFVERGLQLLNKQGKLGFILPHKFFNAEYGEPLRGLIAEGKHLAGVVHFGHQQVFGQATTYTCLLYLNKAATETCRFMRVNDLDAFAAGGPENDANDIPAKRITTSSWNFAEGEAGALFERLMSVPTKLDNVAHIFVGLQTSADKVYVLQALGPAMSGKLPVRDAEGDEWNLEVGLLKPFLSKVSLQSHARPQAGHWLLFPYDLGRGKAELIPVETMARYYPEAWRYLQSKSAVLKKREGGKWNHATWHGYIYKKNLLAFESQKLVVQVISKTGRYAFDDASSYFTGGGNGPYYGVRWKYPDDPHSLLYLSGLLNSRLLDNCLHRISSPFRGGYWSYGKRFIEQLPIRPIDFSDPADRARHDKMVKLVESMLKLHEQLAAANSAHDKTLVQRQIDATDRQIDALVYELYGLTEEEIRIVEGGNA